MTKTNETENKMCVRIQVGVDLLLARARREDQRADLVEAERTNEYGEL
jgi:hypothetical protein